MKVVVLFSGGLDSTVLLHHLTNQWDNPVALSIGYGQRHVKELKIGALLAAKLGVKRKEISLPSMVELMGGSALTGSVEVPDGHYQAETMKATVVPNRNMVFLSLAAAYAISIGYDYVAYAAHAGDHHIYADCRPLFTYAMDDCLRLCNDTPIRLHVPLINKNKAEIVRMGQEMGTPMDETWTCYKGGEIHCGVCGACTERKEAFVLAGVADRTKYRE